MICKYYLEIWNSRSKRCLPIICTKQEWTAEWTESQGQTKGSAGEEQPRDPSICDGFGLWTENVSLPVSQTLFVNNVPDAKYYSKKKTTYYSKKLTIVRKNVKKPVFSPHLHCFPTWDGVLFYNWFPRLEIQTFLFHHLPLLILFRLSSFTSLWISEEKSFSGVSLISACDVLLMRNLS